MSEWRKLRIGDYSDTFAGGTPDRGNDTLFGGTIPWVKSTEVNLGRIHQTEEFLSEAGLRTSAAKWIPSGSVLVAMYGATAAQIAYLEIDATANQAVLAIRPREAIEPLFLFYALTNAKQRLLFLAQGSGQPNLNKQIIDNFKIDAPKTPQQRRIAEILTTVDEEIEATESLIGKYQQIKAGLMHDLFTRGLWTQAELDRGDHHGTPFEASAKQGHLRPPPQQAPQLYQDSPLGKIPKAWTLESCSSLCTTVIDCKNRTPPLTDDGHAVIRTPNVRNGEFVWSDLNYTDAFSYSIWTSRGKPVSGDIVITREAPVGEVCMIPDDLPAPCLGQRMMLYRPNQERIAPLFMLHCLQSQRVQKFLDVISGGSTVGHVRVGDIRFLRLPCPHLEEQQAIAGLIEQASKRLRTETAHRSKLRQQKQGLMHDLLTGRVRVDGLAEP